jgi:hypothetical protein
MRFMERVEELRAQAMLAIEQEQYARAEAILERIDWMAVHSWWSAYPVHAFSRTLTGVTLRVSWRRYLNQIIELQFGHLSSATESIRRQVEMQQVSAEELLADPNFESLHHLYSFRVVTGLEEPILVDAELPLLPTTK